MEKPHVQVQTQSQIQNQEAKSSSIQSQETGKKQQQILWDCGSTLYDSFELNSFKRQLDSAIVSRTLSMPHLSNPKAPSSSPPQRPVAKKPSSRISRSLQKLLKSVFKSKQSSSSMLNIRARTNDEYCVYYDKTGALTTIPEVPEIDFGGLSPEINSLAIRRTGSVRFAAATIAISCA